MRSRVNSPRQRSCRGGASAPGAMALSRQPPQTAAARDHVRRTDVGLDQEPARNGPLHRDGRHRAWERPFHRHARAGCALSPRAGAALCGRVRHDGVARTSRARGQCRSRVRSRGARGMDARTRHLRGVAEQPARVDARDVSTSVLTGAAACRGRDRIRGRGCVRRACRGSGGAAAEGPGAGCAAGPRRVAANGKCSFARQCAAVSASAGSGRPRTARRRFAPRRERRAWVEVLAAASWSGPRHEMTWAGAAAAHLPPRTRFDRKSHQPGKKSGAEPSRPMHPVRPAKARRPEAEIGGRVAANRAIRIATASAGTRGGHRQRNPPTPASRHPASVACHHVVSAAG